MNLGSRSRDQRTIKEMKTSGTPRPEKFKTQKSSSKVFASVVWYRDRILLVDYLEKGATITAE
jgi:hypothetical protein